MQTTTTARPRLIAMEEATGDIHRDRSRLCLVDVETRLGTVDRYAIGMVGGQWAIAHLVPAETTLKTLRGLATDGTDASEWQTMCHRYVPDLLPSTAARLVRDAR